MNALRAAFSFPLLGKELTETAARRRTFTVRVVYAVLLYLAFATAVPRSVWAGTANPLYIMGAGRQMFEALIFLQLAGIVLFLPAIMCGRITQEKERDSLVLLMLTELRPWQIVVQKFVGGLVPMLSFLLLGAPLAALAYAFGGMSLGDLGFGLFVLALSCLQVGAMSLMLSAWCRSTVGAFLGTYVFGAAFYCAGPALWELLDWAGKPAWGFDSDAFLVLIPPALLELIPRNPSWNSLTRIAYAGPVVGSIAIMLALARFFLVRRAFLPARSVLRGLFARIDAIMHRANRLTGGQLVFRQRSGLPAEEPIAWREAARRGLGQPQHLVRLLLVVQIPVTLIAAMTLLDDVRYRRDVELPSLLLAITGSLAALTICVQGANAFVAERVHQTLDVLLTTSLSARDIVQQKARSIWRLAAVLAVPLLTICGFEWWVEHGTGAHRVYAYDRYHPSPWPYIACVLLTFAIYFPLIGWVSLLVGLGVRKRFTAIIVAIGAIVAWCVAPIAALVFSHFWFGFRLEDHNPLFLLSPLFIVGQNEFSSLRNTAYGELSEWAPVIANFTFYAFVLLALRHFTLARADRWLRR